MANKNFEVKHGLNVGGTERISSAGAFTGSLASATTATTQSATDNSTKIATTAYTDAAITAVIGGAPGTLDTLNELAAAINDDASYATTLTTALAGKLPLAGGTMTGDTRLNDSVKHKYGSGDYFQAYHDGSNAYLKNTAGWLNMPQGGSGVSIANSDFSESLAKFIVNGAVELYHNGSKKLETTSSGIDVTGGIDVDGTDTLRYRMLNNGTFKGGIEVATTNGDMIGTSVVDDLAIRSQANILFSAGGNTERMRIKAGNGHVGIGTGANPRYNLTVEGNNATAIGIGVDNVSGGSTLDIAALGSGYANHQAGAGEVWFFSPDNINIGGATGHTNDVKFLANNSVNMVVKGDGDVKIGAYGSSHAYKLEVYDGDYTTMMLRAPTYPTLKFRADNQNSGNNGSISIGGNNAIYMNPNNTTTGIYISNDGTFNSSTRHYHYGSYGEHHVRTGGRHGTGTYTLFTNGSSSTQSAGTVEIWGIYGTPSGAGYRMYTISGNRSIVTSVAYAQTNSVPQPTLAWSGANLQVSNSNASLYYHVRVTLQDIGNAWSPTWGNFPGIS